MGGGGVRLGQDKVRHESDTTPTSIKIGGLLVDKDIGIEGRERRVLMVLWCVPPEAKVN